jgi:protease-4
MRRLTICCLVWLAVWLLAAAGCVTVKVNLFEEPGPLKEKTISGYGRDKILLIEVAGVILEGPHRILGLGKEVTTPSRIKEELERAPRMSFSTNSRPSRRPKRCRW